MNLNRDKIKAYLGFATKSNTIIFGTDKILESKKVEIILYSKSMSSSSQEKLKSFAHKNNIFCKEFEEADFFELAGSPKIKAIALSNKDLAEAIKNYIN